MENSDLKLKARIRVTDLVRCSVIKLLSTKSKTRFKRCRRRLTSCSELNHRGHLVWKTPACFQRIRLAPPDFASELRQLRLSTTSEDPGLVERFTKFMVLYSDLKPDTSYHVRLLASTGPAGARLRRSFQITCGSSIGGNPKSYRKAGGCFPPHNSFTYARLDLSFELGWVPCSIRLLKPGFGWKKVGFVGFPYYYQLVVFRQEQENQITIFRPNFSVENR